jgi:hypothetical protein
MSDDESDFWEWCRAMGPPFGPGRAVEFTVDDDTTLREAQEIARVLLEAQELNEGDER